MLCPGKFQLSPRSNHPMSRCLEIPSRRVRTLLRTSKGGKRSRRRSGRKDAKNRKTQETATTEAKIRDGVESEKERRRRATPLMRDERRLHRLSLLPPDELAVSRDTFDPSASQIRQRRSSNEGSLAKGPGNNPMYVLPYVYRDSPFSRAVSLLLPKATKM